MIFRLLTLDKWEKATPFDNQAEFDERELFYINTLVNKGHEVRYDDLSIYNRFHRQGSVAGIVRSVLLPKNSVD